MYSTQALFSTAAASTAAAARKRTEMAVKRILFGAVGFVDEVLERVEENKLKLMCVMCCQYPIATEGYLGIYVSRTGHNNHFLSCKYPLFVLLTLVS